MAHHHYLPQSYLAGFTSSGSKDGFLYVFDLFQRAVRHQRPIKVAFERDLHRIDVPGVDPGLWENLLSVFETRALAATKRVASNLTFDGDDFSTVLNFVALTAVRVPRLRKGIELSLENQTGIPFQEAVNRLQSWTLFKEAIQGDELGWRPEDIDRVVLSPPTPALCEQVYHMIALTVAHDTMLKLLSARTWSLYVIDRDDGEFICSDNPVGITHSPPVLPYRTPGFSEHNTIVSFPLDKRTALIGRFGGDSIIYHPDRMLIATINTQTLSRAWRCLYSPSSEFICLSTDGGVGGSKHVFDHVARQ